LFAEPLDFAEFSSTTRNRLLVCCRFDWSTISPAIFGSLFQSVLGSCPKMIDRWSQVGI